MIDKYIGCLLITTSVVAISGCSPSCANEVLGDVNSPTGNFRAVIFQRNCGATTGPNRQVSIIPSGTSLPDTAGNVLIIGDSAGEALRALNVSTTWSDDSTLLVTYGSGARVFRKQTRLGHVSIRFGGSNR